ncbi:hypothetical protein JMJ56_18550 [Belnapia sp. T18]|uniref:Uncharacterized protein n=1 Tax=Belnapia arida TaxID=2804533 RepID=A0ABS1U643_9PROT|nr:hypothetical protein [Belnapia arida]MBL6080025.1 hypothetical protein [Belnapia arida]
MTQGVDERFPAFNIGLVSVRRALPAARLPEEGSAPALDTQSVVHLDALFGAKGVDELLDAASVPTLTDARAVDPAHYHEALDRARALMRDLANRHAGVQRRVFSEARAVLESVEADSRVLDEACRSLLRG